MVKSLIEALPRIASEGRIEAQTSAVTSTPSYRGCQENQGQIWVDILATEKEI